MHVHMLMQRGMVAARGGEGGGSWCLGMRWGGGGVVRGDLGDCMR